MNGKGKKWSQEEAGGPRPYLGSRICVPHCHWSDVAGEGSVWICTGGASPIRLALTTRILSVWLTRRPRPRLKAPTAEMRLLLQQRDRSILLPSEQLCRCIHLGGLHVPASTDAPGTLGRSVCKGWTVTLEGPGVQGEHSANIPRAPLPPVEASCCSQALPHVPRQQHPIPITMTASVLETTQLHPHVLSSCFSRWT